MSGAGPAAAIEEGRLPGRVWFYSTYACNLACTYCLTESAPACPAERWTAPRSSI